MNILFTKKNIDKKAISQRIAEDYSYDFIEVIKTMTMKISPFSLNGKSLIFSSVAGVEAFFENYFQPNENFLDKDFNRIYCIGEKTKKAVRKFGFGTFKMVKHARDLAEFIIENSYGEQFVHFCGNLALDVLNKALPLQNIDYKKVVVYQTQLLYPSVENHYDAVVFFSPSGVRSFAKHNALDHKMLFSIGETTEGELRKHTHNKIYTSKESNLDDLLSLIVKTLKNRA